ncbi:hypothetical protein BDR06DRAFT_1014023 [Suillus hirtellus]|nr:hypothetical protein BDR06DRAFT_1014023 [Suillus hirtellus]
MSDLGGPINTNAANTSQMQPSLRGPGMRGASVETDSDGVHLPQQNVVKRCLDVVKDFRSGKGSKFDASFVISSIVNECVPLGSGKNPSTIAAIYLAMLDEWESERNRAYRRVSGTAGECQSIEPAGEPARKRAKLDFSCLDLKPTVHENPFKPLSANLRHTIHILQNWSQDQKQAKLKLMYHEQSPEFHESGWADIVAGKSLNLNAIHTIITTSRAIEKHTEVIGQVEFTYGVSETAMKKITKQNHWNAAWNRAARAYKFAFPFRQAELDAYSEHINEQFDQQLETYHGRVIRYDRAVRFRVGNTRRYELSDFECFRDLYASHFSAGGQLLMDSGESTKLLEGGREGSSKWDACHKWNNGDCTRSASSCRYAHICNVEQDGRVCGHRHVRAKHAEETKSKSS